MGGFFNMDGPFYRFGNALADVVILSLLWFIFSIPIVTIGASTTAMFYVSTRRISNKEGYLFRDFWKSFRSNFIQATVVWLIIIAMGLILFINIANINLLGDIKVFILPFQICFMIELVLLSVYIFPIIARFQMNLKDLFKTAFFMANKHLLTSIACIFIILSICLFIYIYGLFLIVSAGVYAYATSYFLMKVFKKYRPEIDNDENYETP